ncbi:hypothetical protein [Aquitalea denitrificans]|uniref:hypothetical protein n=1 Tax=Aquitalea denitrificans TaxID=519081 RepID=UPI00135C646D|nr:hypothetical protein [Aquitalea denitrificans]
MTLATPHQQRHNAPVPFNSGSGLGGPNKKADSRLAAIFSSVTSLGAPFSMVGLGRGVLARAGSFLPVRQPYLAPTTLAWRREVGFLHKKEATMPSITRALSRMFPISSTISTAATMAEAQTIARLHLARTGHAVRIAPAARGFSVVEVR